MIELHNIAYRRPFYYYIIGNIITCNLSGHVRSVKACRRHLIINVREWARVHGSPAEDIGSSARKWQTGVACEQGHSHVGARGGPGPHRSEDGHPPAPSPVWEKKKYIVLIIFILSLWVLWVLRCVGFKIYFLDNQVPPQIKDPELAPQ